MKFTIEVMPMKLCIKKVDSIKYLGVTIDSKIPWSQKVDEVIQKQINFRDF